MADLPRGLHPHGGDATASRMNTEEQAAYDEALRRIEKCRREGRHTLNLSRLGLTRVPPEIGQLTALERLDLWGNDHLTTLPPELERLSRLRTLEIDSALYPAVHPSLYPSLDPTEIPPEMVPAWEKARSNVKQPWWKLSTHESAGAGVISVWAILETLLGISGLFWLCTHLHTAAPLVTSLALTPFVMLRSEDSLAQGVRWWRDRQGFFIKAGVIGAVLLILAVWRLRVSSPPLPVWTKAFLPLVFGVGSAGFLAVMFFLLRATATLTALARHPLRALAAIPQNWRRIVLATDSHAPPEFLPGVMTNQSDVWNPVFVPLGPSNHGTGDWKFLERWIGRRATVWFSKWTNWTAFPFLYLSTVAYRWSVKATCLFYLPLIWLVRRGSWVPRKSVKMDFTKYLTDELRWVQLVWAVVVLGMLALKLLWVGALVWVLDSFQGHVLHGLAMKLVVPPQIERWQVASAANVLLGIGMWIYARRMKRGHDLDDPPSEAGVILTWRILGVLSLLLSIYTIGCTSAIIWSEGGPDALKFLHAVWERIGGQWFPG